MASGGRGFNDWDECDDSTYDPQYPDDNISGGVNLDHCRLYITNIPKALNDQGLRQAFAKYGTLSEVFISKDPVKRYGLVAYETPSEASLAMMKLNRAEPLRLNINVAHKKKDLRNNNRERSSYNNRENSNSVRDDTSIGSRRNFRKQEEISNDGDPVDAAMGDEDFCADEGFDPELSLEMEQLKLEHLKLKEQQNQCKQRMLLLNRAGVRSAIQASGSSRSMMPDGRIVVRNDKVSMPSGDSGAGPGDMSHRECSCGRSWEDTSGSSTPSTCILCSDGKSDLIPKDSKSDCRRRDERESKSDVTSKRINKSEKTYDLYDSDSDDETNRLIELRHGDYLNIVDDDLKIVVALSGYPRTKIRLRQMEEFQRTLRNVIEMQLNNGLLKKVPSFLDYYINRGALVCICKDAATRDWFVRVSPGLQERMRDNFSLLKCKVKRLCVAQLKIPRSCWPSTAVDVFRFLQYFNPTLKTHLWRVYSQKIVNDVECTSFLIDRVSGEIIRGQSFKNIIDYNQMDFELTGYSEIYFESYMSDVEELCSVASRVKLLEEIRSEENTPRNDTQMMTIKNDDQNKKPIDDKIEIVEVDMDDIKKELDNSLQEDVLKKLKDVTYVSEKDEVIIWSDANTEKIEIEASASVVSEKTESVNSIDVMSSNLNIDSNRGIAYHRRTNYLHVDNELKIAIVLAGYPKDKLDGTHIRRLKQMFKEYLNKDMKQQRFTNMIIPKFQDVYLANGAVIYICDSLETKDYLIEILPKFINSTTLKLTFRDIKDLVRYTRVVMRMPKEYANVDSKEVLSKLQAIYPEFKPECWKFYSDVAGKQKRQFGVDPASLEIIKRSDFRCMYKGEEVTFKIIDRKKQKETQVTIDNNMEKMKRDKVLELMYCPVDTELYNTPLTRIRTNHYSDIIADDLKLYVGPSNYPETNIDEYLFFQIKKAFEDIVMQIIKDNSGMIPKIHDMYLFDGVIFIICKNMASREWVERSIVTVNSKLKLNLKSTEFRGAVGIISMTLKTEKETQEIISILQNQNPRLRTKYWRKISTVRTPTKLDAVLQIDKLSAQIITGSDFSKIVDGYPVNFKLGHLLSLLKPNYSLEELKHDKDKTTKNTVDTKVKLQENTDLKIEEWGAIKPEKLKPTSIIENEQNKDNLADLNIDASNLPPIDKKTYTKMILKIPIKILPDNDEDLNVLFDLMEDNNPGLNTELWQVTSNSNYQKGRFTVLIDKQSASVIQSDSFDASLCGEKIAYVIS